ncbi:GntR family transcriptional regulator [Hyphomonas sp.]|uniref:GntR family transcriptional regulator n=1 Tax=Hyphomonas sp. TaxID=87 RepID=UPI0030FA453E
MTAQALNNWQAVQEEVVRRIHGGVWNQGDLIPNEADLAKEFGCARATVNRALQSLADSGLLDRRRKAGTRVAMFPVRKATLEIPLIRKEIGDKGHTYGYTQISRRRVALPSPVALKMALPRGTKVLHLLCVHTADSKPYVIEERWINPDAVPAVDSVDFSQISPNEWLLKNVPYSAGDIAFSAMSADKPVAALLECKTGEGLFVIDRSTRRDTQAITSVRLIFSPGYRMSTTLSFPA